MRLIIFLIAIILLHVELNVEAKIAWTCKPEYTERAKIIYTDCGYREVSTITLPCRTDFYFHNATQKTEKHIRCLNPEYFPEMKIHIMKENIG